MNNPKISVIIPVYNVEEYLEDTLNCLVNQSFIENMEVLMIDDGSSDNSRYIIEKYELDYDNFYAFHQENKGLANSRNVGMSLAKGEYIQFLDSDDYLSPNCYESLYELAQKNNSDIVSFYMQRLKRYNIVDSYLPIKGYENIDQTLDCVSLNDYPELVWDTFCTNKLFKREFIEKNNLKFKEINYYEDVPFGLEALLLAERISIDKDVSYYWRIREGNNLSMTQEYLNIDNLKGRTKMIGYCNEIVESEKSNEKIRNELYTRWADYDLNIYLSSFFLYDKEFYPEIIREFKKILKVIPKETIDSLDSTKKILYKMLENEDIEGLIKFSETLPDLAENPDLSDELSEEYKECIDFLNDAQKEMFYTRITGLSNDEENIFIEFCERIDYLKDDYPHETKAALISGDNNEYPLEINETPDNKQIILPISLIRDKEDMRIRMEYSAQDLKKECFLRNWNREAIEYDGFDVEMGIEENEGFVMNIRPTSDLTIDIESIDFEDEMFRFYGISNEKIDTAYIENVLDSESIRYDVMSEETDDIYNISFSIPYEDILSHPIKKWEIKVDNEFKKIKVSKKFEFYKQFNKTYIINARNKLLISNDFSNIYETLDEKNQRNIDLNNRVRLLKKENNTIKNENKSIKEENKRIRKENQKKDEENKKLKNKINDYKSRFSVRFADRIRRIF